MALKEVMYQEVALRLLKEFLKQKIDTNSFLFFGPDGVGKSYAARNFIKAINCTGSNPTRIDHPSTSKDGSNPEGIVLPSTSKEGTNPTRIDPDEFEEFLRTSPGQSFQIDQGHPTPLKDGSKMKQILILILKIYRNIFSANMLRCCIFYPSCSQYAIESIEKRGIVKGLYFSILRVLRCNPFSYGGFDPVKE